MEYDASAVKVDEATWKRLQSTHRQSMSGCCLCIVRYFVFFLWLYAIVFTFKRDAFICVFVLWVPFLCIWLLLWAPFVSNWWPCSRRWWRLRDYKEKARWLTEFLRQDKNKADWVVEFHSSILPGREPIGWKQYPSDRYVLFGGTTTRSLPTATADKSS